MDSVMNSVNLNSEEYAVEGVLLIFVFPKFVKQNFVLVH